MRSSWRTQFLVVMSVLTLSIPIITFAAVQTIPSSLCTTWGIQCGDPEVTEQDQLLTFVRRIINAILSFAGLVAVIMIVYGGVRYIISGGDEDGARAGKQIILYAVIGLLIIGLSAAIVNFTVNTIQGRGDVGAVSPTPRPDAAE